MRNKFLIISFFLVFIFTANAQDLLIFGGNNHDVFLGCLSCNKYDNNSIWNKYGDFGSKYNTNCIWNKYGDYGGKYSDNSPFNPYASYPPVLVDGNGNFYGYFTVNKYFKNRTRDQTATIIVENWELIISDVSEAYDKIFN